MQMRFIFLCVLGPGGESACAPIAVIAVDVRVELRGREIGMPQHLLHRAQVGAALQEMRRE